MEQGPLEELLLERYEDMPPQLKLAARFVLDNPQDVALSSMRDQAARAGVSHSTMMRLARWLGMDGYEDMRSSYARALRNAPPRKAAHSDAESGVEPGLNAVGVLADSVAAHVARLGELLNAERLTQAAGTVAGAKALFVAGNAQAATAVSQFIAAMALVLPQIPVRDPLASGGSLALAQAPSGSVLLAIGAAPYDRTLVEHAEQAAKDGVTIVAVTDSSVSPLARIAANSILIASVDGSPFRGATPALAALEILASLVAAQANIDIENELKQQDDRLSAYGVLWKPPR